jgi:3-hydroxyacyl-CoA dehydrogenase
MDASQVSDGPRVAIVGAGIIGSSWALVFARAGWQVRVFARHATVRDSLHARVHRAASAAQEIAPGVTPDEIVARIALSTTLAEAVEGTTWVQESIEESRDAKASCFAEMDAAAPAESILASSTSSIGASLFTAGLAGQHRCLVAHPATPPHLLPVIEVVPSPFTTKAVVQRAFAILRDVGQVPVLVRGERPGFVMNRLQVALLTEMFAVVRDGLMSPADVDALIRDGFGLRWAFLGPMEGIDLNAPGGITDYLARYGFMFEQAARERGATNPVVTDALRETLQAAMRERFPVEGIPGRIAWRDRKISALRALRTLEP